MGRFYLQIDGDVHEISEDPVQFIRDLDWLAGHSWFTLSDARCLIQFAITGFDWDKLPDDYRDRQWKLSKVIPSGPN